MNKIEKKRAELALLEAEEAFREKKAAGTLTSEDRHALRALRQEYRDNVRSPVSDGAAPAAIGTKAKAVK